tara:strand:- start:1023 stop:1340 length:318 start_codon:yes stop_codon:yes gene_type:complete
MLYDRPHFLKTSAGEVKKWMQFLKEQNYNDKDYFETDIFVFKPHAPNLKKFGEYVFSKCHSIQRDQFIVPYALQLFDVDYKFISQASLEDLISYNKVKRWRNKRN